jgi:hypothetical protein
MKQSDQATSVPDGLLVPYHRLIWTKAAVFLLALVLFHARLLVNLANGKDEQQGMGWPRDEGQQGGLGDGEDVLKG